MPGSPRWVVFILKVNVLPAVNLAGERRLGWVEIPWGQEVRGTVCVLPLT